MSEGHDDGEALDLLRAPRLGRRARSTARRRRRRAERVEVRCPLAEGFGRLETAKVTKEEKVTTAADVWNLAQKRLSTLR
jgi:hypothetical protein